MRMRGFYKQVQNYMIFETEGHPLISVEFGV